MASSVAGRWLGDTCSNKPGTKRPPLGNDLSFLRKWAPNYTVCKIHEFRSWEKNDESLTKLDETWKIIIWRLSKWFFKQQSLNKMWWSEKSLLEKNTMGRNRNISSTLSPKGGIRYLEQLTAWFTYIYRYIRSPCCCHWILKDSVWWNITSHVLIQRMGV